MQQKSFIETQFPVSKLSKESYKERKANYSQTLTGLGKWWGRKPLILVRATILALLMPSTDNPKRDRDVFLKILTMDDSGLWRRKDKNISIANLFSMLPIEDRELFFDVGGQEGKIKYKKGITAEEKDFIQRKAFESLTYDAKLELCCRPEHIDNLDKSSWDDINSHLGTNADSLPELMRQLGEIRFGHTPRVGDAFCGGGSVPFETARMGCDAFASDLNPVAALLTWASLNIVGGGEEVTSHVSEVQRTVYESVDKQITEWGIEHNEDGWRADAFLYCTETRCPECGWMIPMAPSWVIGEKTRTVASLIADENNKRFQIEIISNAPDEIYKAAKFGTVVSSELVCPNPSCRTKTPISTIRGDRRTENGTVSNLRMWEKDDVVPQPNDKFQERLYCIRWVETYYDEHADALKTRRIYRSVSDADLERENRALELLSERFIDWQTKGYIPSRLIEPGEKTDEPIRTRGWTYWHHLFNVRQLLTHGLYGLFSEQATTSNLLRVALLLWVGHLANRDSKLVGWVPSYGVETTDQVFVNQALNTKLNWATRGILGHVSVYSLSTSIISSKNSTISTLDARNVGYPCDFWITDPPYADAVNYHELTEFFLAWYEKHLHKLFPQWYVDTKRALAVVGADEGFRRSMVDCYKNLAEHMPDDGMQVVMFTHQDAGVWADLALILWAAGLQVTAAWTIATETEASGIKQGNYVQGTVLLVLRKRNSDEVAFLDEITHDIKPEVEHQLQAMLDVEDKDDPNFTDSDYQLAAYAAALRVLTSYKQIEDLDVEKELSRPRKKGEKSPIESIIESGVKIASNFLIPKSLHDDEITRRDMWRNLSAEEKFYIKGLELESHGDYRQGVYQEFAKGFGLREYTNMLESGKANETRLKTASEFKRREVGTVGFGSSLLRHILFAICQACNDEDLTQAMRWLREEIPVDYWQQKQTIATLLRYIAKLPIEHWQEDARWANLLAGAVENDSV